MKLIILRIILPIGVLILCYSVYSWNYLNLSYGLNLKLTRNISNKNDSIVFPYYYCMQSIKGMSDKIKYKKIINIGLEDDYKALTLSPYRFSVFYDSYRCSVVNPESFADDLRDSYASNYGSSLGRTIFPRFLNRSLINNGYTSNIDGFGKILMINVDKNKEALLNNFVLDYRNKIINLCNK